MSIVQDEKYGDADVCWDEVANVKSRRIGRTETVGQRQHHTEDNTEICSQRLDVALPGRLQFLAFGGSANVEIDRAGRHPGEATTGRNHGHQPVVDFGATFCS